MYKYVCICVDVKHLSKKKSNKNKENHFQHQVHNKSNKIKSQKKAASFFAVRIVSLRLEAVYEDVAFLIHFTVANQLFAREANALAIY